MAELDSKINDQDDVLPKRKAKDSDFNPPVEMMIHDYDDEQTLEEEEALGALEDPQIELSSLQKEGNMPLEDLMAMYGYNDDSMTNCSEDMNGDKSTEPDDKKSEEPSELEQLYNDNDGEIDQEDSGRPNRYTSRQQSEDEEDYDYSPEIEEKKKTIMVGSDYQAWIPEGLSKYDGTLPYENEDKMVWDPSPMSSEEIDDYLFKVQEPQIGNIQTISSIPMGAHIRDDEHALYVLLQCSHNVEEALKRRKTNSNQSNDTTSLWSEDECRLFENGLRNFGKDFRQIQLHKVKTRSVGELVQFYYLWKKTERHDIFANKARLEKKKYALHPGITDYMDRFLEGQDGSIGRDRSTSPNIQCLIYGDPKWQEDHRHNRRSGDGSYEHSGNINSIMNKSESKENCLVNENSPPEQIQNRTNDKMDTDTNEQI